MVLDLTREIRFLGEDNVIPVNNLLIKHNLVGKQIYFGIGLVHKASPSQVENFLREKNFVSKEEAIEKMKLRIIDNDDICVSSEEVSLNDPFSLCRIVVPARSRKCNHLQCFDLSVFLNTFRNAIEADCPVCAKRIQCIDIIIDGFFEELVILFRDTDRESVEVFPDGSYTAVGNENMNIPEGGTKRKAEDVIDLDTFEYNEMLLI